MPSPSNNARTRPTTFRRICLGGLLIALPARAEPTSEAEVVRRYLEAPVARTHLQAVDARTRADRTAIPLLEAPALEARHEAARGDWGATTDAVGASVTVDLGLSPVGHSRAARLRGQAGEHRRRAHLLAGTCQVRADAVDLWAAQQAAVLSQASLERLDRLTRTLDELARAGEASGYDRDRTALAVVAHQTTTAGLVGAAEERRARLSSLVGGAPISEVALGELPPTPSLEAAISLVVDHPSRQALVLERDAARLDRDSARLGQLPDLTVSGGSRWDGSPGGGGATQGFELGGALQIPWTDGSRAEARGQAADQAEAQAVLTRATAELEAAVRGAHRRLEVLAEAPLRPSDPEGVWAAAVERYTAGESSLDDLLQVAEAVEAALRAAVERERMQRQARLDLSCAVGRFADPTIQTVVEEAAR